MSWTYSGDPSTSALDSVRFLVHDTDSTNQLLQDAEINYLISEENSNVYRAAARAAEQLGALFGRRGKKTVGDLSIDYSAQTNFYTSLAAQLRREVVLRGGRAEFTARQKSVKSVRELDTDRVEPKFTKDLHQNPDSRPDGETNQ